MELEINVVTRNRTVSEKKCVKNRRMEKYCLTCKGLSTGKTRAEGNVVYAAKNSNSLLHKVNK